SMTLPEQILEVVMRRPGLTDREISNDLRGTLAPQQPVNISAHALVVRGRLVRKKRHDGLIGNYPADGKVTAAPVVSRPRAGAHDDEALAEDRLKAVLEAWCGSAGWATQIAWAKQRGVDIEARRGDERWLIEVKGIGSRPEMRV